MLLNLKRLEVRRRCGYETHLPFRHFGSTDIYFLVIRRARIYCSGRAGIVPTASDNSDDQELI